MSNSKKVLFFLSNLNGGGAQRTVVNILRCLDRNKFMPLLNLFDYHSEHAFANEVPNDIPIINLNTRGRYAIGKIINIIKKEKPDVVFSTLPQVNAAVSLAHFFTSSKSKLILRETNYRGFNSNRSLIGRKIAQFGYQRSDFSVALSRGVAEELKTFYSLDVNKIKVIYNPIDIDMIQKRSKENNKQKLNIQDCFTMVACGRLVKQKNYYLLLKALSMVEKSNWKLMILGEGPLENDLKQYAVELGIHERVNFMGFQSNPFCYMRQADLFVLSSLWEGFGHVIVESMACGTPVLSTDCPYGPREILGDDEYGWLVPNNNADELSKKIDKLMVDKDEIKAMRFFALERAKLFDVKEIVKQYETIFLE